jgi:fucokinase
MDTLRPLSHGMALAGAGGGGFMYVISKEPNAGPVMQALVAAQPDLPADVTFHAVEIDPEGMTVSLQGE